LSGLHVTFAAHASAQLFASKDFNCGEEILTIAAMISIQVCSGNAEVS